MNRSLEGDRRNEGFEDFAFGRDSGILNPPQQESAQKLYDTLLANNGELRGDNQDEEFTFVQIVIVGKNPNPTFELTTTVEPEVGEITSRYTRGRKGWQDDGSHAYSSIFGDQSKIEPEGYHPSARQRDLALNSVAAIFTQPPVSV